MQGIRVTRTTILMEVCLREPDARIEVSDGIWCAVRSLAQLYVRCVRSGQALVRQKIIQNLEHYLFRVLRVA